jgi:Putative adhesin
MEDDTMQQTFPAGQEPRIIIARVSGDLTVQGWDQPGITVEAGGRVADLHQEGDALMIIGSSDDLELKVPTGAEIKVTNLKGDVSVQNVRRVELEGISSDVKLQDIGIGADREIIGEAVALAELRGDLNVTNASSLRARRDIRGDASLTNVALIEIETVGGDLSLQQAEAVVIGTVGGDLEAVDIDDALSCGNIGGDCQVNGSSSSEVAVGNAGGDIEVYGAASVHLGSVGGDCELRDVTGNVVAGNVGGDAGFYAVGGNLQVGSIGADAELMDLKGTIEVGSIGGDLELQATFPTGSYTRLNVGGDASVLLPNNPNLSIRAAAGGEVVGETVNFGGRGNLISLVYGDGSAHLELSVGGDLEIHGAGSPHSSSTTSSWGDFGSEMAELGREMGRLGQELGREIAAAFQGAGWSQGSRWADEFSSKMDEQARRAERRADEGIRRAEEQARRAEERARQASQRASDRVRIRVNDREWRLDPERIERIKEQARKAATEGVAGALEAVERAVSNLRVPTPPRPPVPPSPPTAPPPPPAPGQTPRSDAEGPSQREQPVQQTDSGEAASTAGAQAPDLEQEREAILRMIAEGRISPEEGDMLLEGLGG